MWVCVCVFGSWVYILCFQMKFSGTNASIETTTHWEVSRTARKNDVTMLRCIRWPLTARYVDIYYSHEELKQKILVSRETYVRYVCSQVFSWKSSFWTCKSILDCQMMCSCTRTLEQVRISDWKSMENFDRFWMKLFPMKMLGFERANNLITCDYQIYIDTNQIIQFSSKLLIANFECIPDTVLSRARACVCLCCIS